MACESQDIPGDIKPPVNIGSDGDLNLSDIPVDTKREMVDCSGIKVEHDTFDDCDHDMVNIDADKGNSKLKLYREEPIKDEPGTFTSDSNTLQPADIKIEDHDELPKYNEEDRYLYLSAGDVDGSSSPYKLKYEEVDLGVMKLDEDRDTTSESIEVEDWESTEQFPAHFRHRETFKTLDCIKCGREFLHKYDLDAHIVAFHGTDAELMKGVTHKILSCKYCRYITIRIAGMRKHMTMHEKKMEETVDCMECRKKFLNKYYLDNHVVTRHGDNDEMMNSITYKIHRCKRCSYITIQSDSLNKHMRTHGERLEKTFDCTTCQKEFSSKVGLDHHIVTWHSNSPESMRRVTNKIHHCEHCKYITVMIKNLDTHMRTHHGKFEEIIDCIECKKKFLNKYYLDNHIVTRHGDNTEMMDSITYKIHRCKHCSYLTLQADCLIKHIRTHEGNRLKTFHCIKCKRKFWDKCGLYDHIVKQHSNVDDIMKSLTHTIHRCKHCMYKTVNISQLNNHMRTHREK